MKENLNPSNYPSEPGSKTPGEAVMLEMRQTVQAIGSALVQYIGLSPARGILLQALNDAEEISQADIQRKLGVGGAVVTRIFKRMEAEGLITRRPDPADNRYMLVRLTEAGNKRQEEVALKIDKIGSTLMQGLSREELVSMQHTLERIRQNAESLTGSPAGDETFSEGDNF